MYQFIKGYRNDPALRQSFNALAEETFGLNFEAWYHNGFWGSNYEPYSMVLHGKVVANVSLNRTDFVIGGQRRRVYQLGTVMTAPDHRNRGLIRAIMAEIEKDTADADGIYLFGNDGVVEFYPKFGFVSGKETVYEKEVSQSGENTLVNVPMNGPEAWNRLRHAMARNIFSTGCSMVDNPELIFFYVTQFMQDTVWLHEETGAWIIAEQEDDALLIHNIFAADHISLDDVIGFFGKDIRRVTLGFSPADPAGWTPSALKEDDCNFFVKGPVFDEFQEKHLRIPTLSHA